MLQGENVPASVQQLKAVQGDGGNGCVEGVCRLSKSTPPVNPPNPSNTGASIITKTIIYIFFWGGSSKPYCDYSIIYLNTLF